MIKTYLGHPTEKLYHADRMAPGMRLHHLSTVPRFHHPVPSQPCVQNGHGRRRDSDTNSGGVVENHKFLLVNPVAKGMLLPAIYGNIGDGL